MQFHQFLYPADIRKRLGANFLTAVCPTSFTHDQLPSLIDEHGYNDFTCDDLFRHKDGKACVLGCMSKVINPLFCLRKGGSRRCWVLIFRQQSARVSDVHNVATVQGQTAGWVKLPVLQHASICPVPLLRHTTPSMPSYVTGSNQIPLAPEPRQK